MQLAVSTPLAALTKQLVMKKWIVTIGLVLLAFAQSWASHVAGGHINYTFTGSAGGNNSYDVQLTFYRFCGDGASPANNSEDLVVVSNCGGVANTVTVDDRVTTPFTNNCGNSCFEEIVYFGSISIPSTCGEVTISWTENERNPSPFYAVNDLYVESTIFPQWDNSSIIPDFNTLTACLNQEFTLDLSTLISEPDGDLVVYNLSPPRFTANNNLQFTGGFSWDEPLSTQDGVSLDNGILSFTPVMQLGNTVFSLHVQEFENGILVADSYIDFTVLISTCQNVAPTFSNLPSGPVTACIGETTTFTINFSDFENQTVYVNDDWYTPRGSVTVNGNQITVTFTPNWWDEAHNSSFTITLLDEACVGYPATNSTEIVFDIRPCNPETGLEFCGHQCMPQLPPVVVTLHTNNVVTITNDCQQNGGGNGHPAYWIIENAIGYSITIWGEWEQPPPIGENGIYDPWYHCEEVNINGLFHQWALDQDPSLSNPYFVGWDGINDNNTIVLSETYHVRIHAWNCNSDFYNIDQPFIIYHDGACTGSGVPLLPFNCPPKVFEFDDDCGQVVQCPPVLNVTQPQPGVFVDNSVYEASNLVTAANYHLVSPSDVELIAGGQVILNPGVTVENGAKLVARIESCGDGPGKWSENDEPEQNPYRDYISRNTADNASMVSVYPNPNTGNFTIEGSDVTRAEIFDALGALAGVRETETNRLIVSDMPQGVYLVKVYDSANQFSVHRVIVVQ